MSRPVVRQTKIGNVLIKMLHFVTPEDAEPEVSHKHDYTLLIAKGKVNVVVNGEDNIFTAPHIVYAKSDTEYKLQAVTENSVVYGVYALREANGLLFDVDMVPNGTEALKEIIAGMKN